MTDTNDGTALDGGEAPAEGNAPAAAPATDGELASLRNRNSGLNAKVTELQKKLADEQAARTAAEEAARGKAGTDDVLNKRIAELEAELAQRTKQAELAQTASKYPEAYSLLGEGVHGMPSENLAALEARLTAAKDDGEEAPPPRPVGNNQQRQASGPKSVEEMTVEELKQSLRDMPKAAFGLES